MSGDAHNHLLSSPLGDKFKVAGWVVEVRALTITNDGVTRKLEPKVMDLLSCLATARGEVMTRDELVGTLWPEVIVGYDSLTTAVIKLRKAFGDDSRHPRIIETVPKVGYRLIAEVEPSLPNSACIAGPVTVQNLASDEEPAAPLPPATGRLAERHRRWLPLAAAAIVLVLVVIGVLWWQPWVPEVAPAHTDQMAYPLPAEPSIAVLPFDNLTGTSEEQYLVDGLTENIITELSRFKHFFVIARNSTLVYKEEPVKVQQVAEELGVRYVVEGSVQTAGERVRVTVQLIDALGGKHLWVERFDRDLHDIFAVQDEITRTIAATLEENIDLAEYDRIRREPVENLKAYELVMRGLEQSLMFTREGSEQAKRLFEKALELDPDYSEAYLGLAFVHLNGYRYGWSDTHSREESFTLALETARRTVELDPFNYRSHWILAKVTMHSGDLDRTMAEYDRAIELNPNDAGLLADSTEPLGYVGRSEEAISRMKTAMRLNPRYPDWYLWNLASYQYEVGEYEDALASFRKMNKMPNMARKYLVPVLVRLGRMEEARAEMAGFREQVPDFTLEDIRLMPYKDKEIHERLIADLRKAGLPEG
ncbi:MAG: tetratricopeptide repeat protein [Gammaproteobacteria bacterium]|nr:tetratricopeptide repeat protein [Gammaproteobacteria bacterium]NIR88293.1 tetratricopeptide repeat protein [Gammaproteobacteria bacterium]